MGGRSGRFRDGSIDYKQKDYWIDFGNKDLEKETSKENLLTNDLKRLNIKVSESFDVMEERLSNTNLSEVKLLTEKYKNISNATLNFEELTIRAFPMDRVSIKTGVRRAEYETIALFHPTSKQICFNQRVLNDYDKATENSKRSQNEGWSSKTDKGKEASHTIAHEYGHFIENCIIEKKIQQNVHKWAEYKNLPVAEKLKIWNTEERNIKKEIINIAVKKYKASEEDLKISKYGDRNGDAEWFAEVFAETNLHTTKKPIVQAMKDFLKKENKQ